MSNPWSIMRSCLTMYPISLETVLGAEVAFLSYLLTAWALKRTGVISAVLSHALPSRLNRICHYLFTRKSATDSKHFARSD